MIPQRNEQTNPECGTFYKTLQKVNVIEKKAGKDGSRFKKIRETNRCNV